jgi:hypothetical protein
VVVRQSIITRRGSASARDDPGRAAVLIGLIDADVPAIQEVNGPVVLLEERAGQAPGGVSLPTFTCTELEARSIIAQRLQSASFLVFIPRERSMTRAPGRRNVARDSHDRSSPSKVEFEEPTQLPSQVGWVVFVPAGHRNPHLVEASKGMLNYRGFRASSDWFVFCSVEASNDGERGYVTCEKSSSRRPRCITMRTGMVGSGTPVFARPSRGKRCRGPINSNMWPIVIQRLGNTEHLPDLEVYET